MRASQVLSILICMLGALRKRHFSNADCFPKAADHSYTGRILGAAD